MLCSPEAEDPAGRRLVNAALGANAWLGRQPAPEVLITGTIV
jgi:hypothetical protein